MRSKHFAGSCHRLGALIPVLQVTKGGCWAKGKATEVPARDGPGTQLTCSHLVVQGHKCVHLHLLQQIFEHDIALLLLSQTRVEQNPREPFCPLRCPSAISITTTNPIDVPTPCLSCVPATSWTCVSPQIPMSQLQPPRVVHRIHFSVPLKRWLEESYLFLPRPLCTNAAGSAHRDGGLLKGRVMEAWGDVLVALQGHRGLTLKTVFVAIAMLKKTEIWGPGPPSAQVLQQTQDRLSSSKDGPGSDHTCWVALPHRRVSVRLLTATREGLPNHPSAHSSGHHKSYPCILTVYNPVQVHSHRKLGHQRSPP